MVLYPDVHDRVELKRKSSAAYSVSSAYNTLGSSFFRAANPTCTRGRREVQGTYLASDAAADLDGGHDAAQRLILPHYLLAL